MSPRRPANPSRAEPPGRSVDRDFAVYCESKDPEALARVFDASARKLLQLALHLGSSEAAAEDLVQQTFLRIIERSSTFETGRRFMPWATTVLQNEARAAFRRAKRRSKLPEVPPAEPRVPTDLATECEALEALEQALAELPPKYRDVLRLKLVEGLGNQEIGAALGLEAATVRTRVHRGLQRLRQLLPQGIAATALLLLHGRGLAQVRERVLQQSIAKAAGPGLAGTRVPASSLGGWLAALALVVTLVWWLWPSGPGPQPKASAEAPQLLAAAPGPEELVPRQQFDPATQELPPAPVSGRWLLRGQVRDRLGRGVAAARLRGVLAWGCSEERLPLVQTAADGSYELDIGGLRARGLGGLLEGNVELRVWAEGFQPSDVVFVDGFADLLVAKDPLIGDREFSADIELRRGAVVRAQIRGPGGKPRRASLRASIPSGELEERAPIWRSQELQPGEPLCLALPEAGAGRLVLYGDEGSLQVELPPHHGADLDLGVLELQRAAVLRARVLVQGQAPFPYAYYELRDDAGRRVGSGRAERDGSIVHHSLASGSYSLLVDDRSGAAQVFRVQTDAAPVDLSVQGQLLVLQVCDAEGRPVPAVPLRSWAPFSPQRAHIHDIRFEAGRYHCLLPIGSAWIFAAQHWLVEGEELAHTATLGEAVVHRRVPVRLRRDFGRLELSVRDPEGNLLSAPELRLESVGSKLGSTTIGLARLRAGVPAGMYRISAVVPGCLSPDLRVDLRQGSLSRASLQLSRGATLVAQLHGAEGLGRQVQVGRDVGGRWWPLGLLQNAQGSYIVDLGEELVLDRVLRPRRMRLQARAGRLRSAWVEVDLRGARQRVDFELRMR